MNKNTHFELIRTILGIFISLAIAILIIFAISNEPTVALKAFLTGPLKSVRHFGNVLEATIPLIFTGLAISIMFQAKQFNLGAEGSFFIGSIAATVIAIKFTLPFGIHPAVAIIIGGIVGGIVCLLPAVLKTKWNAHEFVSSLMLNYIVFYIGMFVINYYLRDVNAGAMVSQKFQETAVLGTIVPKTRIHWGIIVAIGMIIFCYYFLYKTRWGYEIRMVGQNKEFAEYSGINAVKVILYSQAIGGFIAGMGGSIEVLGMYTRFSWSASPGYGWDGVIVSILARRNPALIPISAFFLAYLRTGADIMSRMSDVQSEVVAVIQGIMILLIAAERFLAHWKNKKIYSEAKSTIVDNTENVVVKGDI
ncbi:ABC transporter permease [Alkaliphilus sp. B6464]|uniref:ABC transporter permease n=1 Tax=Alkaliphilus sp. B6464 TaxID=2731219 RepID=UPI001BA82A25|nr:ABC transporter permease [Alkaliphilus sp. B6464]QUH19314.1 ABC transporter permease [Alkaliphilus sp. B6464]